MSRWPALPTQIGMSVFEPLSVDRTASTSPTSASLMPRMSSISGPGQKLPRASMTTVGTGVAMSVMGTDPQGWSRSDEQRLRAVGDEPEIGGCADRLAHAVDEVGALEAEHVHRHLAGDELDAHELGHLHELGRARDAVLLRERAHHPRAHAQEVHGAQLAMGDPRALHRAHRPLH